MRALLQEALNAFTKLHDKRSESMAMNNLGVAYERLGDLPVPTLYRGALRIKTAMGDKVGAIQSLGNLQHAFRRAPGLQAGRRSTTSRRLISPALRATGVPLLMF